MEDFELMLDHNAIAPCPLFQKRAMLSWLLKYAITELLAQCTGCIKNVNPFKFKLAKDRGQADLKIAEIPHFSDFSWVKTLVYIHS